MFQFIRLFLNQFFIEKLNFPEPAGKFFTAVIILAGLVFLWIFFYQIFRMILHGGAKLTVKHKVKPWLQAMIDQKFLINVAKLLPALIIVRMLPAIFEWESASLLFFFAITNMFVIFQLTRCISSFLDVTDEVMAVKNGRKPIKSYLQVVKVVLWTIAVILIVCIMVNKSPAGLIAGIGAFSAVLLLVFQDTITGFVNSIQLSSNDMVRIGDWITDSTGAANGIVEEVNLIAVKVRNFDNTIVTVPIKSMVNNSFQNWRTMREKHLRRITRSIHIDVNTIRPCTPEMLEKFRTIDCLRDYLDRTQAQIDQLNEQRHLTNSSIPNAEFQTNLGVMRAYMVAYLEQHPLVDETSLLMVRHHDPGENGLPVELYCFVRVIEWKEYEAVQADLFDHFYAVLPFFGLRAFQRNTDHKIPATLQN